MFDLGFVVGAMLDPIVIVLAVASYFVGKSFPDTRWAATWCSALVSALALFLLVAALSTRPVHGMIFVFNALAIAAWIGICAGVAAARAAISSPPPTAAPKTLDRSPF